MLALGVILVAGRCVSQLPVADDDPVPVRTEQSSISSDQGGGEPLTKECAFAIARKHFDGGPNSGFYFEDRGDNFFVAPPIKTRKHLEKAGILIDKQTGEVRPNEPSGQEVNKGD